MFDEFLVESRAALIDDRNICSYMERNHGELLLKDAIGFIRVNRRGHNADKLFKRKRCAGPNGRCGFILDVVNKLIGLDWIDCV